MAPKATKTAGTGKSLLIVESPSKVKTIAGYLGDAYEVESSMGHIRDLPQPSELPTDMKKGPYGKFAVDVEHEFDPYYVVNPDKKKKVTELKRELKEPGPERMFYIGDAFRAGSGLFLGVEAAGLGGEALVLGHEVDDVALAHQGLLRRGGVSDRTKCDGADQRDQREDDRHRPEPAGGQGDQQADHHQHAERGDDVLARVDRRVVAWSLGRVLFGRTSYTYQ